MNAYSPGSRHSGDRNVEQRRGRPLDAEFRAADAQQVARAQLARAGDALAVDVGATGRAEIGGDEAALLPVQPRVPPRDLRVVEHQVVARLSPDRQARWAHR
ncbi:MAG: hypothetical protein M3291_15535, partial [Actinomycetota bacterium]|nr:hypothetical protein [Actinomycetota bacterium]